LTETGKETKKKKKEKIEQRQRKKREKNERREKQEKQRRPKQREEKGKRRSLSVGYQRREGRSFAHWLVRHLWHSKQAGFAGISFSFSFLAIFQSWCLLIVLKKKNMFLLLSGMCVFFSVLATKLQACYCFVHDCDF
jgi:hypothetical protein